MGKLSIVKEMFQFIGENKLYWMAPIVVVLVALAALVILGSGGGMFAFLYAF